MRIIQVQQFFSIAKFCSSMAIVALLCLMVSSVVSIQSFAQETNDKMIEDAAELYGYSDLTDAQWEQIEHASEQVLEGLRSSRYVINLSQAISIVYIGLILHNKTDGAPDVADGPIRSGGSCPALEESVQSFIEFGNNTRNFSLWVKLSLRDDVEELLEAIRQESDSCDCLGVADVADEVRVDTSLTPEKYRDHSEAFIRAMESCE